MGRDDAADPPVQRAGLCIVWHAILATDHPAVQDVSCVPATQASQETVMQHPALKAFANWLESHPDTAIDALRYAISSANYTTSATAHNQLDHQRMAICSSLSAALNTTIGPWDRYARDRQVAVEPFDAPQSPVT